MEGMVSGDSGRVALSAHHIASPMLVTAEGGLCRLVIGNSDHLVILTSPRLVYHHQSACTESEVTLGAGADKRHLRRCPDYT
jgi:hypothetical protein